MVARVANKQKKIKYCHWDRTKKSKDMLKSNDLYCQYNGSFVGEGGGLEEELFVYKLHAEVCVRSID